jgi:TPR repeat protein
MKTNRLRWFLLFLLGSAVFQLPGQQSEADGKALADIRAKAEKGDVQSQFQLGRAFDTGGLGVAKDYTEAVKWYRKAAEGNLAVAQCNLGFCYYHGQGVAKDRVEAVRWFRKAADQNNDVAQYSLGVCYYDGQGVARDYVEAVRWFRKAAEQNHANAQCYLGFCYFHGKGVAKDYTEAVKWYRKAAEQNCVDAQNNLGACYYDGKGLAEDYVEAYKWILLAVGQGHESARKTMARMQARMTREQIAEGQKRARDFKPRQVPSSGGVSSPAQ